MDWKYLKNVLSLGQFIKNKPLISEEWLTIVTSVIKYLKMYLLGYVLNADKHKKKE